MDRVHHLLPLENNSKTRKFFPLYDEAPVLVRLTHSPQISMKPLGFLKIIPDIALATSRNYK
jgi:hypothetical protein